MGRELGRLRAGREQVSLGPGLYPRGEEPHSLQTGQKLTRAQTGEGHWTRQGHALPRLRRRDPGTGHLPDSASRGCAIRGRVLLFPEHLCTGQRQMVLVLVSCGCFTLGASCRQAGCSGGQLCSQTGGFLSGSDTSWNTRRPHCPCLKVGAGPFRAVVRLEEKRCGQS